MVRGINGTDIFADDQDKARDLNDNVSPPQGRGI